MKLATFKHAQIFEKMLGRKWCVSILWSISDGILRPGEIENHLKGISAKVLNQRLKDMVDCHLVEKTIYPQLPPRTEYHLTPFGTRVVKSLRDLDREFKKELAKKQVKNKT